MSTEDRAKTYKLFFDILNNKQSNQTEDDKTFRKNTTKQITNRDKKYTELLSHFVEITKIRNVLKEFFKWTFYLTIIAAFIVLMVIVYRLFDKIIKSEDIEIIIEAIPLLITSMVGFVSVVITIPSTITKYLFSTKEDENITQIILHTQKHDTSGRQWTMDFKKIVDDAKNSSANSQTNIERIVNLQEV